MNKEKRQRAKNNDVECSELNGIMIKTLRIKPSALIIEHFVQLSVMLEVCVCAGFRIFVILYEFIIIIKIHVLFFATCHFGCCSNLCYWLCLDVFFKRNYNTKFPT